MFVRLKRKLIVLDLNYGGKEAIMKFDDWFKWCYAVDRDLDELMRTQIVVLGEIYLQSINDRGWKPYAVISLNKESWMKLENEEPKGSFDISPMVSKWCEKNCVGNWKARDPVWWEMELEEDALAFKLYWG